MSQRVETGKAEAENDQKVATMRGVREIGQCDTECEMRVRAGRQVGTTRANKDQVGGEGMEGREKYRSSREKGRLATSASDRGDRRRVRQ